MIKDISIQRQPDGTYAARVYQEIGPHKCPDTYWVAVTPRKAIELIAAKKAKLVSEDVVVI